jgi:hypothetical protein
MIGEAVAFAAAFSIRVGSPKTEDRRLPPYQLDPAWIGKDHDLRFRTSDPRVRRYRKYKRSAFGEPL